MATGLIGTHWSKGWIIENNHIRHSICSGISLGKYGDPWDNTSADTAEGYVETIERALAHGWSKENIGHHFVDTDYLGRKRNLSNPSPGPFEDLGQGPHKVKVWLHVEPD